MHVIPVTLRTRARPEIASAQHGVQSFYNSRPRNDLNILELRAPSVDHVSQKECHALNIASHKIFH